MELRKFQKSDDKYVKALYSDAFPADERAPFWLLRERAEHKKADFWIICDQQRSIGFAYLVTDSHLAYLFYYAIDPEFRGKGYGTRALQKIIEKYKYYRLFLALEDWRMVSDNQEQRIKRHDFYKNCGLHDLPYRIKEASVIYAIMGTGKVVEPKEYKSLMNRYFGFPMKYLVDVRIIKDEKRNSTR